MSALNVTESAIWVKQYPWYRAERIPAFSNRFPNKIDNGMPLVAGDFGRFGNYYIEP